MEGLFEVRRDRSTGLWKIGGAVIRLEAIRRMYKGTHLPTDKQVYVIEWVGGGHDLMLNVGAEAQALFDHLCNATLNREANDPVDGVASLQPTEGPDGREALENE